MKQFFKKMGLAGALCACVGAGALAPQVKAQMTAAPQAAAANIAPAQSVEWNANSAGAGGVRSVSGGAGSDGVTTSVVRLDSRAVTTKAGTPPPSSYLYFDVNEASVKALVGGPVFVTVEFFDATQGGSVAMQYDSAISDTIPAIFHSADDQAGGWAAGTGTWKTTIFQLNNPRFASRQNEGADFRLSGSALTVRRVALSNVRPAN